jgi:DNA-binding Lrp family transcriptional regulator
MSEDLDRIDFEILSALQQDGRLSNKELAAHVDLAPSSCLERVRKLRERGVIRGYHAEVDPAALGIRLQALIAVRLQKHSRELVDDFRDYVMSLSEVLSIFHVAGEHDFLVHVAVADAESLRNLALDRFTTRPEVEQLETSLIFEHAQTWQIPNFAQDAQQA